MATTAHLCICGPLANYFKKPCIADKHNCACWESRSCAATAHKCTCWLVEVHNVPITCLSADDKHACICQHSSSKCAAVKHVCVCRWVLIRGGLTTCLSADKHKCVCSKNPSGCAATAHLCICWQSSFKCTVSTHDCACWYVANGEAPACLSVDKHICVCLYVLRGEAPACLSADKHECVCCENPLKCTSTKHNCACCDKSPSECIADIHECPRISSVDMFAERVCTCWDDEVRGTLPACDAPARRCICWLTADSAAVCPGTSHVCVCRDWGPELCRRGGPASRHVGARS